MRARLAALVPDADRVVLGTTLFLAGLGSVMVYSAAMPLAGEARVPPLFLRHVGGLALGAVLALAASRLPLRAWHAIALPFWLGTLGLLVLTAFLGVQVNGAQRWLELPGVAFQPAEPAKLATVLAIAAVASHRDGRGALSGRRFGLCLALAVLPAALLVRQPDLGNAVLMLVLAGLLLFCAGAWLRLLVGPALLASAGAALFVALHPYALRRLQGFLNPWQTARDEGFQLVQSFVAFGRGGSTGVGVGYGRQKLHYLPEAHTDFILSVVAEELGLLWVLLVLGAFALLLAAGARIALRAPQRFGALLAFGATLLLSIPGALNAAVVMGALPTKGLTLPLVSYGRSSLLVCCSAVGLLLAVARAPQRSPDRVAFAPRRRQQAPA